MRRAAVTALVVAAVFALSTTALGYWSADPTTTGSARSSAGTVNQGATPTATAQAGRKVVVSWGASALSNGLAVDGYVVKRYDANSDALQNILTGCGGTITGLSCTETSVPAGDWKYTVTPRFAANWLGAEGAKSGTATVGPATLSVDDALLGSDDFTPNATLTGTLAGFGDGEAITYKLDHPTAGTTLTGSPAAVDASGDANVAITLPPTSDGAHTINAIGNAGSRASAGIVVDTAAPNVSAATGPSPTPSGWNGTSPVSVTLSSSDGTGSGVQFVRYTTDGSDPKTSGTAQPYATPISISSTTAVRFFARDVAGNESPVHAHQVKIDTTAPSAGTLTLSEGDAFTHASGATVFYNPVGSGSFTVVAPGATDGDSGVDKVSFPTYTGASGGGDDSSSPYSAAYDWTSTFAATGAQTVTVHNNAGLTDTTSFTLTQDTTAPAVDPPLVEAGFYTTASVPVALGGATDDGGGSGVDTGSTAVQRDATTLANGSCGSFTGDWQPVSLSGGHDTSVGSGNCYRYRERAADNVLNTGTSGASAAAKVDTSVPVAGPVSISASGPTTFASGATVFYNPSTGNSGSFTVTAGASDAQSDIEKVGFPSVTGMSGGANDDTSSPYQGTYSWTDATSASGAQTVTAHNNAALTGTTNFTVIPDTTGPTGGALTVNSTAASSGGTSTNNVTGTITINTRTDFDADAGAGFASSVLTLRTGTLSNGTCSGFGAPSAVSGTTGLTNAVSGCYEYSLTGADRVSNKSTLTTTVKVDRTPPVFGAPPVTITAHAASFVNGGAVFYAGAPSGTGSFTVVAPNVADPESGITNVNFPALAGFASGGGDYTSPPYSTTYTWTASSANNSFLITATNGFNRTGTAVFTLVRDVNAPTGGALSANGSAGTAGGSTSFSKTGTYTISTTNFAEALGGTESGLQSNALTVREGTYSPTTATCGAFGPPSSVATLNPSNQAEGCYQYTFTGTDRVGNVASLVTTVVVDKTRPATTSLELKNKPGGIAGLMEQGDQIVITYSEHLIPQSICGNLPAADGNATHAVDTAAVLVLDNAAGGNDQIDVFVCPTGTNMGIINLGSAGYVSSTTTFQGSGSNRTTLDWDATARTVTVTLGQLSAGTPTAGASSTASIAPTLTIMDLATNQLTTTVFAQPSPGLQF